jgi:hypothetical protein
MAKYYLPNVGSVLYKIIIEDNGIFYTIGDGKDLVGPCIFEKAHNISSGTSYSKSSYFEVLLQAKEEQWQSLEQSFIEACNKCHNGSYGCLLSKHADRGQALYDNIIRDIKGDE